MIDLKWLNGQKILKKGGLIHSIFGLNHIILPVNRMFFFDSSHVDQCCFIGFKSWYKVESIQLHELFLKICMATTFKFLPPRMVSVTAACSVTSLGVPLQAAVSIYQAPKIVCWISQNKLSLFPLFILGYEWKFWPLSNGICLGHDHVNL